MLRISVQLSAVAVVVYAMTDLLGQSILLGMLLVI